MAARIARPPKIVTLERVFVAGWKICAIASPPSPTFIRQAQVAQRSRKYSYETQLRSRVHPIERQDFEPIRLSPPAALPGRARFTLSLCELARGIGRRAWDPFRYPHA